MKYFKFKILLVLHGTNKQHNFVLFIIHIGNSVWIWSVLLQSWLNVTVLKYTSLDINVSILMSFSNAKNEKCFLWMIKQLQQICIGKKECLLILQTRSYFSRLFQKTSLKNFSFLSWAACVIKALTIMYPFHTYCISTNLIWSKIY